LVVYKRSNYSDYFLKLDQICDLITNARHCIDNCQIKSNPFALISMNTICSTKSREDAKLLESCFANVGTRVQQQCVQVCGDYEQINDQIQVGTSTLKPEDQAGLQLINEKMNHACSTLKCSARCSVDEYNRQCGHLANGVLAGNQIREIVDQVLSTYRMDLQVFGLMDSMKRDTQPECNYLHTADVLFNPIKDMTSQRMLGSKENVPAEQTTEFQPQPRPQQPELSPEQQLKLAANRLYVRILKKQLQVLDKQLELMDKQEHKLDIPVQQTQFSENDMF